MNTVTFKDVDTKEVISSYSNDWKFEVGQVFDGFWGCTSTVTKVELTMELERHWANGGEERNLVVVQIVWVKRVPLEF
jgi:hypothetical protein